MPRQERVSSTQQGSSRASKGRPATHTTELARGAKESLDYLRLASRQQLQKSPYLTLGGTFAFGWILGGGIPLGIVKVALAIAARAASTAVIQAALKDATETVVSSVRSGREEGPALREA